MSKEQKVHGSHEARLTHVKQVALAPNMLGWQGFFVLLQEAVPSTPAAEKGAPAKAETGHVTSRTGVDCLSFVTAPAFSSFEHAKALQALQSHLQE